MTKLPQGWDTVPLIDCSLGKPGYGANSPAIEYDPTLPRYVRITDITADGRLTTEGAVSVKLEGNEKFILRDNDFLFARSGATVGKTYLYRSNDGLAIYAGYLIKFCLDERVLLAEYLKQFTQSSRYALWVKNMLRAGAQPNINATEYSSLPIPLPPLSEQHMIVQILRTWDDAIAVAEQLVAALQRRKKGLMQRLLTGQVRFPEFEGAEWEDVELGQFLSHAPRKVPKPSEPYRRMGIRSHGKGTFTEIVEDPGSNAMDHLYTVKGDDLIVNITFAWEQAIAIVSPDDEGSLVSHRFPTYEFNRSKVVPEFFRYLMLTKRFLYQLDLITPGGAGRNRVMSKTDFLKLRVTIPPVEEQKRIGAVLSMADKEINTVQEYLRCLKAQKKGLMQRLLTGQVRVQV